MKKLLILAGAICYCVAPDLFVGPMDDAIVLLASTALTTLVAAVKQDRDPQYMKIDKDF